MHAAFSVPFAGIARGPVVDDGFEYCVVIAGYQEGGRIGSVVRDVRQYCPHVVVVDDGSTDDTAAEAREAGAEALQHDVNRGKGAALNTGFAHAGRQGYEFVITMDGDGQHCPGDIPAFVEKYVATGTPVIIGNRMADTGSMPPVRRLTNRFMSWLLSRRMKQRVPDTQSGYRLYKSSVLSSVMATTDGYAAESEVLLNLAAEGVTIGAVPIKVIYSDEKSKINPIRDAIRFFRMLSDHRKKDRLKGVV